jgi:nitroreductase
LSHLTNGLGQNETLRVIRARRSVRAFTDQPVREEDLAAILEAANKAPSAHNQQSWRFIVLGEKKKQALADLVTTRAGDFPRPSCILLRMASRSIVSAPVVIAVANTGELIRHGAELFHVDKEAARDFFRTMEIQSSAAAVENLLLAATSLGLGSVWLGILYLMKQEVLEFLGEPGGEFMAVVPLGYAVKKTEGPKKRPLETIIRRLE